MTARQFISRQMPDNARDDEDEKSEYDWGMYRADERMRIGKAAGRKEFTRRTQWHSVRDGLPKRPTKLQW
jgi:hypothetical protein